MLLATYFKNYSSRIRTTVLSLCSILFADDFKPSNEEFNDSAMMEITPTNQVTLKYPQTSSEGSSDFMYSGTMKPFPKEYFLVIDHVTGDVTLEKLTANIQLKRTK